MQPAKPLLPTLTSAGQEGRLQKKEEVIDMKNKKILWICETALLLAVLLVLQTLTKPAGQLVTGSCVNAVLAITALCVGLGSGLTIAVLSPIFAFLLGIAPQILTVPAIMAGNAVLVLVLNLLAGKNCPVWQQAAAWLAAAVAKFAVLYLLVVQIICGLAANALLDAGLLKAPMLTALPASFTWFQLYTALIGGGVAMLAAPVLRKALAKIHS